ncbi:uncharacterized protein LOC114320395 [Camellia sinensis]|uniref:uncharacterized protein LOC114320395 n=1 Tax=Camellia sinensis TaxID=4442 RepID=UPI001035F485|nr:uncharacterized protein LOC114320395 [Camellia sinensis]
MVLPQPPKDFRKSFYPNKDFKKLLGLPVDQQKAPLLLNYIPTYKSTLPNVPKKSKSSPSAIQHAHFFTMQAFDIKKELTRKTKEVAGLLKTINKAEAKMKTLIDQTNTSKQAQDEAKERAGVVVAIVEVLRAEKIEVEEKIAEAQAKLIADLATKDAEIKAADEKAYAERAADVREDYKKQVKKACNKDEEDEVQKTTSEVEVETSNKSLDDMLREIDAEVQAEKSARLSAEADITPIAEAGQIVENA